MVMTAHFNDDFVLVALKELEVHLVRVAEPHRVIVVSCTAVDVLDYDKLPARFSTLELVL